MNGKPLLGGQEQEEKESQPSTAELAQEVTRLGQEIKDHLEVLGKQSDPS